MTKSYKLVADSAADLFHRSRAKIRLYGGGFANGKTTALVADALRVARDYPGATILLARSTYPKLNDTLRAEFIKWCPEPWIKSFDKTKGNVCALKNGTIIRFRYIADSESGDGERTSNLLSANYDYIGVDQIDDVEITHEHFLQLLGRLRGQTEYVGDDPTMPRTGPRMIALTCNPTLGWAYHRIVKPIHDWRNGIYNENLICEVDSGQKPVLDNNNRPIPLVEIFEATTYDNAQNLGGDYIKTLEAAYTGKMRDRYMLGKWVAFDGVVYDEFDENIHAVTDTTLCEYISQLRMENAQLKIKEGYDFGISEPSCYLFALEDMFNTTYILDGFYEREMGIADQADKIKSIREKFGTDIWSHAPVVRADPAIFRRTSMGLRTAGDSIAEMFRQQDVHMERGNNNILNGIIKVKQKLRIQKTVINPFTHAFGAPKLYVSNHLRWFIDEITTYRWKKNKGDEALDIPVDRKNHAMDALKYMESKESISRMIMSLPKKLPQQVFRWNESESVVTNQREHRYS